MTHGVLWTTHDSSNGVDVFVLGTGKAPVRLGDSRDVAGGVAPGKTADNPFHFGHDLGVVYAGETIYVAFGTNGNPGNDASYTDFSIDRGPLGTRMLVR